tara:strand:+ start:158 stop:406 length:249 start_codon:yes stop_codon:yes gene_type:complete
VLEVLEVLADILTVVVRQVVLLLHSLYPQQVAVVVRILMVVQVVLELTAGELHRQLLIIMAVEQLQPTRDGLVTEEKVAEHP